MCQLLIFETYRKYKQLLYEDYPIFIDTFIIVRH